MLDQFKTSEENYAKANASTSAINTQLKVELEECNKNLQEARQNLEKTQSQGTKEVEEAKQQLSKAQNDLINIQNKQQQQIMEAQNAQKLAENQLSSSQKKMEDLQNSLSELSNKIVDVKDQIKQQLDNINKMISNSTGYNKNYDDNILEITGSLKELMNLIANPPSTTVIPTNPSLNKTNVGKKQNYAPITNVKQLNNYQEYLKGGKTKSKTKSIKRKKTRKNKKGGYNYLTTMNKHNSFAGKDNKHK